MKRIKASAFLFILSVLFVMVVNAASGSSNSADTKRKPQSAKGRSVYTANCARCHGADGAGQTTMGEMTQAPNISDAAWQSRRNASRMIASVSNGRGQMPAFKKKLSKQDIAAAVAYVRSLKR